MRSRKVIEKLLAQGLPRIEEPVAFALSSKSCIVNEEPQPSQAVEIERHIAWIYPASSIEKPTPEMVARILAERMGLA